MKHTPILLVQFDEHIEAADESEPVVEFVMPESIAADVLDDDALAALETQATEAFDALYQDGEADLNAEQVAALEDLAGHIESIREEARSREGQREANRAEAAALAARIRGEEETETEASDDEGDESDDAPADGDAPADEPADEPAEAVEDAEEVPALAASGDRRQPRQRQSRVRVPVGQISRRAPQPDVPAEAGRVVITASAAVPSLNVGMNDRLADSNAIGRALHAQARNLGEGHVAPVASISRGFAADRIITERHDAAQQDAILASAARLPGDGTAQALVAAGGWCAPSETLYDQFSIEGTDGMWDVPTVQVRRGGISFVIDGGPSIADVMGDTNIWLWTEENDIDALQAGGPTKICARIPCPEFDEERLVAHGVCLTHGNLSDIAYPENTDRFVNLTMAAHAHTMNARHLAIAAALSDDVTIAANNPGTTAPVLSAIDLQVADYRDKYRMDEDAVLEAVFPNWLRSMVRADLAYRAGVDLLSVTNADVVRYMVARQIRPQFVYDWQSLQTGLGQNEVQTVNLGAASAGTFTLEFQGEVTGNINFNANAATVQAALEALPNIEPGDVTVTGGPLPGTITITFGGNLANQQVDQVTIPDNGAALTGETITIATTTSGGGFASGDGFLEAWPTTARFMLYAAGTWARGVGGSLDLRVTRDSVLNETNDHTAAFTEEFDLIAKRGHESRQVIVTGLQADGQTGPVPTS